MSIRSMFCKIFRDFSSQLCSVFLSEGFLYQKSIEVCVLNIFSHISIWMFHSVFSYAITLHPDKLSIHYCGVWKSLPEMKELFQLVLWCFSDNKRESTNACEGQISCMPLKETAAFLSFSFICGKNLRLVKIRKLLSMLHIPCTQDKLCNFQTTNRDSQFNCYHLIILIKNSLLKLRP